MKRDLQGLIRSVLRRNPDGMSRHELEQQIGTRMEVRVVRAMPDVYVDRWIKTNRKPLVPVYVAVPIPPDCPHPEDR